MADPPAVEPARAFDRDVELERLHDKQFDALVRLASLLLQSNRAAAEDVVQDAFADVYRAWNRIDDIARLPAYVRSVVLNRARNRLRRRRIVDRMSPWAARDDNGPEPEALAGDRRKRVLAAIDLLPERQRECVIARYYLDLSGRETAELLGISPGSVKTHLHRALRTLADRVEDDR